MPFPHERPRLESWIANASTARLLPRLVVCSSLALASCTSDAAPSPESTDTVPVDSGVTTPTDGDSEPAGAAEPLAETEGFTLLDAQLTDEIDPATGGPGARLEAIDAGEPARIWLSFDDAGAVPGKDTLFVSFVRVATDDDTDSDTEVELFRTAFRLPQPTGQQNVALGAADTAEPGDYRAEIAFNDDVLHVIEFVVRA